MKYLIILLLSISISYGQQNSAFMRANNNYYIHFFDNNHKQSHIKYITEGLRFNFKIVAFEYDSVQTDKEKIKELEFAILILSKQIALEDQYRKEQDERIMNYTKAIDAYMQSTNKLLNKK